MFTKIATLEVQRILDRPAFDKRQASDRRIVEYDPSYVFVVVRAVTADRPNNNGDCFPHDELIRIDANLKRPVWASFIGKGIYVNHKNTDDPRIAKGIILDARYVTSNTDDKYVELLLGVDRKKDPIFARDIERGLINKFSMGASVQWTKCSVCSNEARREADFCEHIAKHKMRECKASDGKMKLAYEECRGVTYNEISAVSDPADETAQTLARIASSDASVRPKRAGIVNQLKAIHASVTRPEEASTMKTATNKRGIKTAAAQKRKADGMPFDEEPSGPPIDEAGGAPGPEGMGEEGGEPPVSEEAAQVADILSVVTEMVEEKIPPAQAVEQLEQILGPEGEPDGDEMPAEEGEAPPPSVDVMPMNASRRKHLLAALKAKRDAARVQADKRKGGAADKGKPIVARPVAAKAPVARAARTAGDASPAAPPFPGQYPKYNEQGHPTQHHSKPQKGRSKSDFKTDVSEYHKMMGITARFIPAPQKSASKIDLKRAAWLVCEKGKPLFMITGGGAWGNRIEEKYSEFASREYGAELIRTMAKQGIEAVMDLTDAVPVPEQVVMKESNPADATGILQAAEVKAAALAQERVEAFKERFIDAVKLGITLQDKNVIDNPIRAAAYEILTAEGHDGSLAERMASGPVVEAQFDEAIRQALTYTEMKEDAFAEVKAHVTAMPAVKVGSDEGASPEAREDAARTAMRRRASFNGGGLAAVAGNSLAQAEESEDAIRRAMRGGRSVTSQHATLLTQ